jgi:ABC-type uncharacterized transport system substrate-binding protein
VAALKSKIQNRKLAGILAIVVAIGLSGVVAQAQQTGKIFRIGYLDSGNAPISAALLDAFRQELGKIGWNEGKNFSIEHRFAEQRNERLPELAADLAQLKVDLILVSGGPAAVAAKKSTSTIPVVMANVGDPVGEGLVASLARPGANITGLSALSTELNTKRLEILKDAFPQLIRAGLLWPSGNFIGQELQMKELRAAAMALNLSLEEIETRPNEAGLESAFKTAKQKKVGAVITTTTRVFFANRKRIVKLAGQHKLPAIYFQREFVDEGGLMSYGADFADLFRRAAHYVDKILKGTKPADLPVQQATKFEFIINLRAAKQIGLTIPVRVLERANQLIK